MSVCAVMMVKDEADVIEYTIRHLLTQVDHVIVADNLSTDGTSEILLKLHQEYGLCDCVTHQVYPGVAKVEIHTDPEVGYWQSRKTTNLANVARQLGHDWVIPCDADEMWIAKDGRSIRKFLLGIAPDVPIVEAALFNYIPTAQDSDEKNPFARTAWRQPEAAGLPKVCCRLWPGLEIEMGNHGASYNGKKPRNTSAGLRINHYPWRSAAQFASKVRNGARAYALTDLPEGTGTHWRMWGDPEAADLDERAGEHFRRYFWAPNPPCAPNSNSPDGLIFDPAIG